MITFNRVDLSDRINVTSISGRGPLSQNAIRSKVPGKVGSYYQSREVPERIIPVGIEIPGESLEDIRQKVDELNGILSTEVEVPIVFSDEPTKTYYGILDGQPNWEEIVFIGKGTISFLCTDPCKYGQEKSESFINDTVTLVNNGSAPTRPIIKATFPAKITSKADFKDKVAGSTVEIPHISKHSGGASLNSPSTFTAEQSQSQYNSIMNLDGNLRSPSTTINRDIAQHLFSFDLISHVERKYNVTVPGVTTADKVAWLKVNIQKLTANWHGRGSTLVTNPIQKADFVGKVSGSTVENPHISKYDRNNVTLLAPSGVWEGEASDYTYDRIKILDGQTILLTKTYSGQYSQQLFSFNLIEHVQRKYNFTIPGATTADKVAWLKANISKLTANWHGRGSTLVTNPIQMASLVGKISGSNVENPHTAKYMQAATLQAPTGAWTEFNNTSTSIVAYEKIFVLDGIVASYPVSLNGNIPQQMFSFNLIEHVQRKYNITVPGVTVADKVAWLKANVVQALCKWYGKGSGPNGNKAFLAGWNSTTWGGGVSHSNGQVSQLSYGGSGRLDHIDANGFIHFIAYSDAADGTTASRIETDFVELEVEMKSGYKASLAFYSENYPTWKGSKDHVNSNITKLTHSLDNGGVNYWGLIDSNGFVHFLAYADPSNGLAPSKIETDFIELEVEMNSGYKANFKAWKGDVAGWTDSTITHTKSTIEKLSYPIPNNYISIDGFTHFLSFADASNGLAPSKIETDYIELEVELNNNFTKEFKVTNQDGKYVRVIRDFVGEDLLELDFKKEKVLLNGNLAMTMLDWVMSDFFDLKPGKNTLTIEPVGVTSAEVIYPERWL